MPRVCLQVSGAPKPPTRDMKAAPSPCPHRGRDGNRSARQVPPRAGRSPGCGQGADPLGLPCGQRFILLSCCGKYNDVLRAQAAPCNPATAAWGRGQSPAKARTRSPPRALPAFVRPARKGRGVVLAHSIVLVAFRFHPREHRKSEPTIQEGRSLLLSL